MNQNELLKIQYLQALQEKERIVEGLPHLHRWKHYKWSREFFESKNRQNFLVAANQIGKSSCQIRKAIHWATEDTLWPTLWRKRPAQFWYLYPTLTQVTTEFYEKWETENLPRGQFKEDAKYGWEVERRAGSVFAIHFHSGVSIYFKTYAQDPQHLQSGSVDAVFCDEELPVEIYDELMFRLAATDGYFHMVFTATLGQEKWKQVMEGDDHKDAFKRNVSMYDCLQYEDGSPSHWTLEKIERIKNSCRSEAEILKRVYGKFTVDEGLIYPGFSIEKNIVKEEFIPKEWAIYAGVDIGTGGADGHPAAITFVAVNPQHTMGRVFMGWRGDGVVTTATDVLQRFQAMRGNLICTGQYYDWHSKDFMLMAARLGDTFLPADKSHEKGEQILNVLFKSGMLKILDKEELHPLVGEIQSLLHTTRKNEAKDDFVDSLRYAVSLIPWDWSVLGAGYTVPQVIKQVTEQDLRRENVLGQGEEQDPWNIEKELEEWSDLLEA